jgi:hypothetical protein
MYPPIFAVCRADSVVQSYLGVAPTRLFLFGEAPNGVAMPYAVWQDIGGEPSNYIADRPDMDRYTLQVDVYATSVAEARYISHALRDAIEPHACITSWRGTGRDPITKLYRYSFDVDWLVSRDEINMLWLAESLDELANQDLPDALENL